MCPAHKTKTVCKTCGKPIGSALSVTQWISGADCQCAKLPSAAQSELKVGSTLAENLCWGCGYPFKSGREGSFTQWIFRSNLCQCKDPILHRPGVPLSDIKSRYSKQRKTFDPEGITSATDDVSAETLFQQRYALLDEIDPDEDSFAVGAQDIVLSKTVSIVRFNPVAEENASQCQALARRLSTLQHPAITPLLDFGIDERNRPFFVADFVNELTLSELIDQENALPSDTAFDITMQLCDCLEYAHSKGVYHGDLNSDNVFISLEESEPSLRLIEFGYSAVHSLREGTQSATNTNQPVKNQVERNRDLLSVASLLYEMLSGSRPFQEARAGNLWSTVKLEATDLENPEDLNELLSRVFSSNRQAEKFESIAEFKKALAAYLKSETAPTFKDSVSIKTEKAKISKTFLWAASAILTVVLAALAMVSILGERRPAPSNPSAPTSHGKSGHAKKVPKSEMAEGDNRYSFVDKVFAGRTNEYSFENLDSKDPVLGYLELSAQQARRLASLKTLNSIYLVQSDFTHEAIEALSKARIRQLDALYCMFDDRCLISMLKNPKLETLKLMYVPVTDKGIEELKNCKNLKYLSLGPIDLTDAGWSTIGELENLTSLNVVDAPTFTNSQLRLVADRHPKRLEQLKLYDVPITSGGYKCLSSIPTLKRLFIYRSNPATSKPTSNNKVPPQELTDQDIDDLLENKKIRELHLYNADISGAAWKKLLEAQHIERLSFMGENIPANCLPSRSKTKHLKYLNICQVQLEQDVEVPVLVVKEASARVAKLQTLVPVKITVQGPTQVWTPYAGGFVDMRRPYHLTGNRTQPFKSQKVR